MSIINRTNLFLENSIHLNWHKVFAISLSIGLGMILGFLSSRGDWLFAIILACIVPAVILFSKRPFLGVIIWLLLMPLSSASPNSIVLYWVIHRMLIPFTLLMMILSRLANVSKYPLFRIKFPDICVLFLAVYVPVSFLFFENMSGDLLRKFLDRMLIPIIMYLAIRSSHLDKKNIRVIEWTALIVALIQITIGFASWVIPSMLPQVWRHNIGYRTAGSLGDPAVFTSLLVFCAVILINAVMHRKNDPIRFIYLVVVGLSFIGVFISLSRGSWLAGIIVLIGLVIFFGKRLIRLILFGGFIITIVTFSLFSNQISMVTKRMNEQKPVEDRIVVTDAMIQMIMEKPVFGWGYDSLNTNLANYYRLVGSASIIIGFTTSHNTLLTILVELGVIGFLLYLLPFFWLISKSIHIWRSDKNKPSHHWFLLVTFWLGSMQYFVVSNFMDMRFFPIGLTLWWMILGLIANLVSEEDTVSERYELTNIKSLVKKSIN